jgi:UDP-glucosyl transferase 73C
LVVDVLKTGVEVGVEGVTQWATEQKEVKVGRNAVQAALSKLMDDGIVAEEMRMRAKEFGIKAREALAVGGSSHTNISLLIQEMGNKATASD